MQTPKPFVAIVDDDASVGRSIKRLLRSIGIEAEAYLSGDEFLDLLGSIPSYRPSCVVLDVQMPGMNGLEVQKRLAERKLPIIFITAHDDITMREKALATGAFAFLRKPFSDEMFIQVMRVAIQHSNDAQNKES